MQGVLLREQKECWVTIDRTAYEQKVLLRGVGMDQKGIGLVQGFMQSVVRNTAVNHDVADTDTIPFWATANDLVI